MAVGSRAGKKQVKTADKGIDREPGGAEKALIKARAKLDKRRRQVEKALALVASLEIRSIKDVPRASNPATAGTAPAKRAPAKRAPAKRAPAKASLAKRAPSKPSPAKAPPQPRASKRGTATATAGSAKAAPTAGSAGAAPRRRSVKPPSAT